MDQDLTPQSNQVDLQVINAIIAKVKVRTSYIYKGRIAKSGHIFYLITCEHNHRNHWEVRQIPRSKITKEQEVLLINELKNKMAVSVATYKK